MSKIELVLGGVGVALRKHSREQIPTIGKKGAKIRFTRRQRIQKNRR
jgi:hypothetical protein